MNIGIIISILLIILILIFFTYFRASKMLIVLTILVSVSLIIFNKMLIEKKNIEIQEDQKREVLINLSKLRAQLEMGVSNNISLIHGLASFISIHPDISQTKFEDFSRSLMTQHSNIINFGAAPDLVIKFVYPLEGNEKIIGLDYRKNPLQAKAALQATEIKKIIVAGPVKLVQGGEAFVGRIATYTKNEKGELIFWGLVSAPISINKLYEESGVYEFVKSYHLTIQGKDCLGSNGEVFFGEPSLLNNNPISMEVLLPYGSWLIAAEPIEGWQKLDDPNFSYWLVSWLLIILFSSFIFTIVKSQKKILETNEKLLKSETLFRVMFENSPVGIALLDKELKHVNANKAYQSLTGYSEQELLNEKFNFITDQDYKEHETNMLLKFSSNNNFELYSKSIIRKSGDRSYVNVVGSKVLNILDGNLWVFVEDITKDKINEMKILNEKEIALQERGKAEYAAKAKSLFLSTMSHEIRTPLNGIILSSDLLNKENLSVNQKEYSEIIFRSGKFLLNIINDILDLGKLDAGKMQIEKIPVDIKKLVEELHRSILTIAIEKNLQFDLEISEEFGGKEIISDPTRLAQVITNLCSNAIKFTSKGSIKLSVVPSEDKLLITVKDTGIGMNEEQSNKLFNQFTQLDSSISRKYGGTGLGLSICKSICDLMHGKILLSSKENVGTTFVVEFPLIWAKEKSISISNHKNLSRNYNKKILLVDDNAINIKLGTKLLNKMEITVDVAYNGLEAIKNIRSDHDMVLMDIQMPLMDGIEAFKEIRKQGYQMPIVALTANVMQDDVNEYLRIGFNKVVGKPFHIEDFVNLLDKYFKETPSS